MVVAMWVVPHMRQLNWSVFNGVFPDRAADAAPTFNTVPIGPGVPIRPQVRLQK